MFGRILPGIMVLLIAVFFTVVVCITAASMHKAAFNALMNKAVEEVATLGFTTAQIPVVEGGQEVTPSGPYISVVHLGNNVAVNGFDAQHHLVVHRVVK